MTNTIKLQTSYMDDIFYNELTEVKFTDDRNILNIEMLVSQSRVDNMGLNSIDMEELFADYLKGQEKYYTEQLLELGLDEFYELEDIEDNEDFRDLLEDNRDYLEELVYLIAENENKKEETVIDDILNQVNYTLGKVGYSQWSYFIAPSDLDYDYIYDLYHGHSFYTIELIINDDPYEITDYVYLNTLEDLDKYVKELWSLREYDLDQSELEEYEELV